MVKRQRRSRAESSVYWRQQIADWKLSGQTIRAFCSQRNLTESQFHLWKRMLGVKPNEDPGRVGQRSERPRSFLYRSLA